MTESGARKWVAVIGLAASLAVAGCSSDPSGGTCSGGTFTAKLSSAGGGILGSYSGKACQSLSGNDWSLGLYASTDDDAVVIGTETGNRASLGPHPLPVVPNGSTDLGTSARLTFAGKHWSCSPAATGTLALTTSSDASAAGSISIDLLCSVATGDTVYGALSATFQAVSGDVPLIR